MQRGVKLALGVLVLAGLGFAQWKFNAGQQLLSYIHPQQQATSGTSGQPAAGGNRAPAIVVVKLAQATPKDFPLIERSYGTMASPQSVAINARVSSQVTKVNVQDGQMVKSGDVLVELDDRALQAVLAKDVATLAKDQANLSNAEIQLSRARTLLSKNAAPQADVDTALAAQKSGQQIVESDQAVIDADKLQLDFAKVTAPFDGKLGALSVVPGALVSTAGSATGLMTITQMQPLKVTFRLPEQTLSAIRTKMDKNEPVPVRVYASGTHDLLDQGKLDFIDSSVDVASGTIGMAATVGNEKLALWPGQRVQVEVEHGIIAGALTVPAVAVQQGQIGSYVWVADEQNKVKATPIKVARFENDLASVTDGLNAGAQVVIEGQAKLANGTEVRTAKPADAPAANTSSEKPAAAATTPQPATVISPADAATPPVVTDQKKHNKDKAGGDQAQ